MSALPQAAQSVGIFHGPYYLSIAGNLLQSHDSFDVINPATGEAFAKAPSASAEHLDEAVAAASHAFKAWSALGYDGRQKYLNAYADALEVHRDELSRLLTLEQGKPLKTMAEPEVDQSIAWIRQIAARRIPIEIVEETEEHIVELHHTPLGVIGAITPWNFPCCLHFGRWRPR
nr:aldehyde dehydrogenase family protein [Paraburkholderia terrae]